LRGKGKEKGKKKTSIALVLWKCNVYTAVSLGSSGKRGKKRGYLLPATAGGGEGLTVPWPSKSVKAGKGKQEGRIRPLSSEGSFWGGLKPVNAYLDGGGKEGPTSSQRKRENGTSPSGTFRQLARKEKFIFDKEKERKKSLETPCRTGDPDASTTFRKRNSVSLPGYQGGWRTSARKA